MLIKSRLIITCFGFPIKIIYCHLDSRNLLIVESKCQQNSSMFALMSTTERLMDHCSIAKKIIRSISEVPLVRLGY